MRSSGYKSSSSLIIHASNIAISAVSMVEASMFGRLYALPLFQGTRCLVASIHSAAIRSPQARTIYRALFDALTAQAIQAVYCRRSYASPIG